MAIGRGRALEKLAQRAAAEQAYQQAVALDGNQQARSALERLRAEQRRVSFNKCCD
jgi:predicted RNA polymerase sigma factor